MDLREPLAPSTVAELRELWLRHKVVFVRDQHLEAHHQVAFAHAFGRLTRAHPVLPSAIVEHPEVLVLDSRVASSRPEYEQTRARSRSHGWHTDVTFVDTPPTGSILAARQVPDAGGDTLWADTQAAYEGLDEPLRRLVDGLTAVHDGSRTFGGFLAAGFPVEWEGDLRPTLEPVEHPVVRTHPETGARSLFVNPQFTSHIVGLSPRESDALLTVLFEHMTVPEFTVRWRWRCRRRGLLGQPHHHALRHPGLRRRPPDHAPCDAPGRPPPLTVSPLPPWRLAGAAPLGRPPAAVAPRPPSACVNLVSTGRPTWLAGSRRGAVGPRHGVRRREQSGSARIESRCTGYCKSAGGGAAAETAKR